MHGVSGKRPLPDLLAEPCIFGSKLMVFTHVCVNGIADDTVRPRIDLLAADVVIFDRNTAAVTSPSASSILTSPVLPVPYGL